MVADSPSLTALFDTGYDGLHARLLDRSDDEDVAAFLARFADFTYHYGCRGPNEWETRSPTWETEPDLALAAIDRMRLSDPAASPLVHNADRAAEREALGDEIAAMLDGDPETQAQFRAALHSATVFMPGRERTKTNCVKLIHEWRMAFHEFGHRRVADGTFHLHTDFGLLRRDELREAVVDPGKFTDELREREALLHEVAALQEPFLFAGARPDMSSYPGAMRSQITPVVEGESVQGVPGCPGIAKGIARVVTDSHDPTVAGTGRHPGRADHRPVVDPAVRAGGGRGRRRRRAAQPRDHRQPRTRYPVCGVGDRRHQTHPRRRAGRGERRHGRSDRVVAPVGLHPYVEEDQEEEGQDAPFEGESRQAPQHGSLTPADR